VVHNTWEAEIRRTVIQGQPGQTVHKTLSPISRITRAKWTGGVVQTMEYLLCSCEALSSNPSPTKKKKKPLEEGKREGGRKEREKEREREKGRKEGRQANICS
jgi:hypothetical protein